MVVVWYVEFIWFFNGDGVVWGFYVIEVQVEFEFFYSFGVEYGEGVGVGVGAYFREFGVFF